jgi:hypothetical protein
VAVARGASLAAGYRTSTPLPPHAQESSVNMSSNECKHSKGPSCKQAIMRDISRSGNVQCNEYASALQYSECIVCTCRPRVRQVRVPASGSNSVASRHVAKVHRKPSRGNAQLDADYSHAAPCAGSGHLLRRARWLLAFPSSGVGGCVCLAV